MKIQPLGNIIQIKVQKVVAGALQTDSKKAAVEFGEVVAVGDEVPFKIKKGDKVFFKSWALDIVNHEGDDYFFISTDTNGILAIVK